MQPHLRLLPAIISLSSVVDALAVTSTFAREAQTVTPSAVQATTLPPAPRKPTGQKPVPAKYHTPPKITAPKASNWSGSKVEIKSKLLPPNVQNIGLASNNSITRGGNCSQMFTFQQAEVSGGSISAARRS